MILSVAMPCAIEGKRLFEIIYAQCNDDDSRFHALSSDVSFLSGCRSSCDDAFERVDEVGPALLETVPVLRGRKARLDHCEERLLSSRLERYYEVSVETLSVRPDARHREGKTMRTFHLGKDHTRAVRPVLFRPE